MINKEKYSSIFKGIVVVEVSGESCANCYTLLPLLNSLISKRNDCQLVHIEANEDTSDFIEYFEIEQVPTILLLKDGKVESRCKGYQPEEILELWLDAKINKLK